MGIQEMCLSWSWFGHTVQKAILVLWEYALILIPEPILFFVKIDAIYVNPWVVDMKYKPLNKLHWKARLCWYTYFLLSFPRGSSSPCHRSCISRFAMKKDATYDAFFRQALYIYLSKSSAWVIMMRHRGIEAATVPPLRMFCTIHFPGFFLKWGVPNTFQLSRMQMWAQIDIS